MAGKTRIVVNPELAREVRALIWGDFTYHFVSTKFSLRYVLLRLRGGQIWAPRGL